MDHGEPQSIGQLHALNGETKRASPERRLAVLPALRAKESKLVIDEVRTWLMTQKALSGSALGKAIGYTSSLWLDLVTFLRDAKMPLRTNGVERTFHSVAGARRNHHWWQSEKGTWVAALSYAPTDPANPCGVEPRAYQREATLRAVQNPGIATLAHELKSPQS